MKLTAQRDDLSQALSKVELALSSGIDLYRQIHLAVDGKWAVLTGTNATTTIKTALKVDSSEELHHQLLIPPEVARAVRTFDPGEVTLSKNGTRLELQSEHGPKFRFGYGGADSYPRIEFKKKADFVLSKETFSKVIHYLGAIRTDTVALQGSELGFTDNFRLGIINLDLVREDSERVLMPMSLFMQAERVLTSNADVEWIVEERRVTLRQGGSAISALRSATKFPDLKKLLGGLEPVGTFIAMKSELLGAMERASVVASNFIPMQMDLKSKQALISASRSDVGDSDEKIAVTWDGTDFKIALSIDFFRSIISVLGPQITVDFGEPNEMFRISSKDDPMVLFVMMPVKKL